MDHAKRTQLQSELQAAIDSIMDASQCDDSEDIAEEVEKAVEYLFNAYAITGSRMRFQFGESRVYDTLDGLLS